MDLEVRRTSRLSDLIPQENTEGLLVHVYHSENNWESCEEIQLTLEEDTRVAQLIDFSILKFRSELHKENIELYNFDLYLFRKKKKIPKTDYPKCDLESLVKDYGKTHFCLVEKKNKSSENKENDDKNSKNKICKEQLNIINSPDKELNKMERKKSSCFNCGIF